MTSTKIAAIFGSVLSFAFIAPLLITLITKSERLAVIAGATIPLMIPGYIATIPLIRHGFPVDGLTCNSVMLLATWAAYALLFGVLSLPFVILARALGRTFTKF